MDYLDFELEIGQGTGQEYPVTVLDSPGGEAREVMRFPFDKLALESRLKDLEIALLRSGGTRRRAPSNEENSVLAFGQTLFNALFTGEVRSRYDVSNESAARDGSGLRLKLRIQDPVLAALPWEFLYDPRQGDFICLSRNTPLVRYLELPQRIPPLKISPPLRILGVVASPTDLPALDLGREKERVTRALAGASEQGLIELTWMRGQTWRDLQGEMQGGPWHVLHFVGHGGFDKLRDEGFICVAEDDGTSRFLYATDLARLLADHRTLRIAVLNACEGARGGGVDIISSMSSILVRRGLPAVLAMQYEITDAAAIELSRAFYEALANGLPVDAAVSEARKAVSLEVANTVEWGTPVLTMRAPDGVLFDVIPALASSSGGHAQAAAPVLRIVSTLPQPGSDVPQSDGRPLAEMTAEVSDLAPTSTRFAPPQAAVHVETADTPRSTSVSPARRHGAAKIRLDGWRLSMITILAGSAGWVLVLQHVGSMDYLWRVLAVWAAIALLAGGAGTLITGELVPFLTQLTAALAGGLVMAFWVALSGSGDAVVGLGTEPSKTLITGIVAAIACVIALNVVHLMRRPAV